MIEYIVAIIVFYAVLQMIGLIGILITNYEVLSNNDEEKVEKLIKDGENSSKIVKGFLYIFFGLTLAAFNTFSKIVKRYPNHFIEK